MSARIFARALGFVALLAVAPAFAQTNAPAAAPATPGAPTAAQIALARDIVVDSGVSRSFAIVIPQFLDQIGTRLTQTRPDLIKDLNVVTEQIKPEFDKRVDQMVDTAARLYAERMSEQELKDVSAFFKSASGKKYVEQQPLVLNALYVSMQGWQQQLSQDMMARVREEMKKKGHEM
ncbi:MAG TPA: DUF2059 domain-containing protein [Rhodoblastus sp.]|nr:DUF2059 domain-containing protein [Rhodoblastus sp.]